MNPENQEVAEMAINSLADLSDLSFTELYAVYLAIARSDHQWRVQTLHGQQRPPLGYVEFRPLSESQFHDRLKKAQTIAGGESMLRSRLARQAAAYEVDVEAELAQLSQVS